MSGGLAFASFTLGEKTECMTGDAKGERIEEHCNTKLNLFIWEKETPLSKVGFIMWLINNAHTWYELATADKNFFFLCFLICEKAIQIVMQEIRKIIWVSIKNLNSLAAYLV